MGQIRTYSNRINLISTPVLIDEYLDLSTALDLPYCLDIHSNDLKSYNIFTAANKPRGSYIGDGSYRRRIEVTASGYASGSVMLITCKENNLCAIVTLNGCFVCDGSGVSYEKSAFSVAFYVRYFTIWNSSVFNRDGVTYEYFVL